MDLLKRFIHFFKDLLSIRSVQEDDKDELYYVHWGWRIVIFGFCAFLLWAAIAPLDKGVVAPGSVITDGQRKLIQPAINGVIEQILVKDGDHVQKGQLLLRLNDLQTNAQFSAVREQIEGLTAQITGLEKSSENQKLQLSFISQQLVGMRDLAKDGYVAKNRLLELERAKAQLEASYAETLGNLERYRRQLNELKNKLPAAEFDYANATIESPVDGDVINLSVFTVGQYVQAGAKLMEVVPVNQPLIVEAKVPVNLIDKVRVGLPVEMAFTAFNQRTTPRIPGTLIVVSSDKSSDPNAQGPDTIYYKVQAKVSEKGLRLLKEHDVRPGMPVDLFIRTGERSLLNYIFKPMLDRAHNALIEE